MKSYLLCLLFLAFASVASAQSTAFMYQGHLMDAGASANGNYDIQFTLKNALSAGATVGTPQAVSPVAAANGIFTVTLDFGSAPFDGSDRWVELGVRPAGSAAAYTVLVPRQRLTATPYALRALSATSFTGNISPAQIPAGTITGAMIAPGATITSSTAAPAASVANSGDNPAALSLVTPYRTWWVGQNNAPDAIGVTDNFFIYDQQANATRLRIDVSGVIYGNGAGLTGVAASTVGGVSAADVASGANLANAATAANTPSTIVKRDGSGNFSAGTVTATAFIGDGSPANVIPVLGMVWIKPGTFVMGSRAAVAGQPAELGRFSDEGPQTVVTLTKGFWMGCHEVTQAEYQTVAGSNPSAFTGDTNRPVETVSWTSAVAYCTTLTTSERAAGRIPVGWGYRLPSEAEWEYCCRAGARTTRFGFGDDLSGAALGNYAWYSSNSSSTTHPVEQKLANSWGLMDMHGNVCQWCQDWYGAYPGGSVTDPPGPVSGSGRVIRGGSWNNSAANCRSALRDYGNPGGATSLIGFRVVLSPGQP